MKAVHMMKNHILGIDIGGTKCAVTLGDIRTPDADKIVKDKVRFDTESRRGWRAVTSQLLSSAELLMERNGLCSQDIICAGISCGGPLDSSRGIILSPPNLPDWDGVEIVKMFEERLGIKAALQNDANACAVAEWKFGAGQGLSSFVFLTFGTGMGAGLILDGRLYSGCCDMAGEVGHMRIAPDGPCGYGKSGSFEGFCSGAGIASLARSMAQQTLERSETTMLCKSQGDIESITAKSTAQAAEAGDKTALEVYRTCGEKLGEGLAILIDILNPQAIIIGSIFQRSGHLLSEAMEKSLSREALTESRSRCKIIPAALGDSIGDLAALGIALNFIENGGCYEQH